MTTKLLIKEVLLELSELESSNFKSKIYSDVASMIDVVDPEVINNTTNFSKLLGVGTSINLIITTVKNGGIPPVLRSLRSQNKGFLNINDYKVRENSYVTKGISRDEGLIIYNKIKEIIGNLGATVIPLKWLSNDIHSTIFDIDILIPNKSLLPKIKEALSGYIVVGENDSYIKILDGSVNDVVINIRFCEPNEVLYSKLFFTKSSEEINQLKAKARDAGFLLNCHGLFERDGLRIPFIPLSVDDIVEFLNKR